MPKTQLKNEYLEKIAFVNDQLCYFHFADEEVHQIIGRVNASKKNNKTTDIFVNNKYSKRIDVKFDDLLNFRLKAKAATAGMSLSFGVEQLLYFLEEITDLKSELSSTDESDEKNNSPEEKISNNLIHWKASKLDEAIIKTIKYLRLRRNHIVHSRSKLTDEFDRVLRLESHHLKTYWSSRSTINDLDFSSKDVDAFTSDEIYTCMKLIRVCLEEIDSLVAATFTDKDLVSYMTSKILEQNKRLKGAKSTLYRKVRFQIIGQFGIEITPKTVQYNVDSILATA